MLCPGCEKHGRIRCYWPLTTEFWDPRKGLARCRTCWTQKKRLDEQARRRADPLHKREENRAYFLANRDVINLKRRSRRAEKRAKAA